MIYARYGPTSDDLKYFINGQKSDEEIQYSGPQGDTADFIKTNRKITIGIRDDFNAKEYFDGTLLEVIGYNKKLTGTARKSVENYLRCKYNILSEGCGSNNDCKILKEYNFNRIEKSFDFSFSWKVYQLPSEQKIIIQFIKGLTNEKGELLFINSKGQMIFRKDVDFDITSNLNLETSNFPNGIYFLILRGSNAIFSKKVIVNH
ncbi:MAG: T9SS type A sorting domain-containing protein [Chitinophagales bacterium]|nr:T9SS type A sorting domain-containing protein [Chitinophagales bacterium]